MRIPPRRDFFYLIFEGMNSRKKKILKRWLTGIFLVYLLLGLVLFFVQDQLLFHPQKVNFDHQYSFTEPFEEININLGGANLNIVRFRTANAKKGLVLFYHGNMNNVEHYAKYPSVFLRNGYEVWMLDYPGFGKTTGRRSETIIYKQALKMYDLARETTAPDSIIVYGKSIGTGVAAYVAANREAAQLLLETPYYSIEALAKHYFPVYPVAVLSKYRFPIFQYLINVKAPITLIHGTSDGIVPYQHSLKLKREFPKINLVTIKNGEHNNLSSFEDFNKAIDSVLLNRE